MKATLETIAKDINELERLLTKADSKARLNDDEIMIMSETLAFLVFEIRQKYGLTSGYYCIAENQAAKKYSMIYD